MDGIPNFYTFASEQDSIYDRNTTWLDPEIVEATDTVYRLCDRELRGMEFCMREIGRRTCAGCHVLEVGMGTGHFTRWLAEVSEPGTQIYAFEFSWPISQRAPSNTRESLGITIFRANTGGALPFAAAAFDIVFMR